MLFVADSGSTGRELWITDGTTAGTRLLKDINPGATGSNPQNSTPWVMLFTSVLTME